MDDLKMEDITASDIRTQFLVPNPKDRDGYLRIKRETPARLGLWRAGPRYKTQVQLRFRADHARAQDAVHSYVSEKLIDSMGFIPLSTLCKDKEEYLQRPDLGRRFDDENLAVISSKITKNPTVQVIIGDGLSSAAITSNIREILPCLKHALNQYGLDFDMEQILFIKHARVRAMDMIGDITNAGVICYFIGERPGLATDKSMSAYIAYRPTWGMTDACRNVVSNIHENGTPAPLAANKCAKLIAQMLEHKCAGVQLNDKLEKLATVN